MLYGSFPQEDRRGCGVLGRRGSRELRLESPFGKKHSPPPQAGKGTMNGQPWLIPRQMFLNKGRKKHSPPHSLKGTVN